MKQTVCLDKAGALSRPCTRIDRMLQALFARISGRMLQALFARISGRVLQALFVRISGGMLGSLCQKLWPHTAGDSSPALHVNLPWITAHPPCSTVGFHPSRVGLACSSMDNECLLTRITAHPPSSIVRSSATIEISHVAHKIQITTGGYVSLQTYRSA